MVFKAKFFAEWKLAINDSSMKSLIVLGFLLSVLAPAAAEGKVKRAAYFLDNNPAGSSVISLKISEKTGLLSYGHRTSTGGVGLFALNALQGGIPLTPDSLLGSSQIISRGNYLFTLNAGSNTLAFFLINPKNPLVPKLVGKPVPTLGEFPQSVAYSSKLNTVCVVNAGAVAGVACFSVDEHHGLYCLDKTLRTIPNYNQTTPPVTPTFPTTSELLFNPSETALFLLVKGSAAAGTPGFVLAWPVVKGAVSFKPVVNSIPSLPVPFSATFLGTDSRVLISDVTFGGSILNVSRSLTLAVERRLVIFNQTADCWTAWYGKTHTGFIFDGAAPQITVINTDAGVVTGTIYADPARLGVFDTAIDRSHMYTLAGDAAVIVTDLDVKPLPVIVQNLDLSFLGSRDGWVGMTTYPFKIEKLS